MNRRRASRSSRRTLPTASRCAVDPQRRDAHRLDDADDERDEHRAANDERHEDRAARPEHLAERQLEDAARRAGHNEASRGSRSLLHQILEHGLQVVVGRRDFVDDAGLARRRHVGEPRVERIGPRRLDDDRARLEAQADDAVFDQQRARQRARIVGANEDRCADARR